MGFRLQGFGLSCRSPFGILFQGLVADGSPWGLPGTWPLEHHASCKLTVTDLADTHSTLRSLLG